ncbi:MAG TPA: transglycosylase SLT domain-containing protein [Terracidiphilus sp.]|nr:transglycosylase SLT domain-containing protein [Terracidiphilus sp.]
MRDVLVPMLTLWLSCPCIAQTSNLVQLRDRCAPTAPLSTLAALIKAESGGNPYAIQIDFPNALLRRWRLPPGTLRLQRQPNNAQVAGEWIAYLNARHISVDVGLMQVSTDEAVRRHIPPVELLDPCANVRTGWAILEDDYKIEVNHFGPGQIALQHALSRYNTGDTNRGIDNGYFARVTAALRRLQTERPDNETRIGQGKGGGQ